MRTLIIGTGISAASWVATAQRQYREERIAVGDPHLWQKLDPRHAMGQPRTLLTGQLLGAQDRGFSHPGRHGFMGTQEFAELVDRRLARGTEEVDRGWVTMIRPIHGGRHKYTVDIDVPTLGGPITVYVDRIIIATGPGPLRPLEMTTDNERVDVSGMGGHVVSGNDFLAPDWRPPKTMFSTRSVAIYGGSATAAWGNAPSKRLVTSHALASLPGRTNHSTTS
jgi:hypothetical protein